MSITRNLAVGGLAGLAMTLAGAAPAGANGTKAVCITEGAARTNPPVPVVGGKGSYAFSTQYFHCVAIEKSSAPPVAATYSGTSSGVYKNVVCGTGKANSTSNAMSGQTSKGPLPQPKTNGATLASQLSYTIEFIAGEGVLYFTNPAVHKVATPKPMELVLAPKPTGDGEGLGGVVSLIASPTNVGCAEAYVVVGMVVIDTETR